MGSTLFKHCELITRKEHEIDWVMRRRTEPVDASSRRGYE